MKSSEKSSNSDGKDARKQQNDVEKFSAFFEQKIVIANF